jgi:hypothetical protein
MRGTLTRVGCMPMLDCAALQLDARRPPRARHHSTLAPPAGGDAITAGKAEMTGGAHTARAGPAHNSPLTTAFREGGLNHPTSNLTPGITRRAHNVELRASRA